MHLGEGACRNAQLERMRRLRLLEEHETWKQEARFEQIKIVAQMDAQRFRISLDSEPLYTKLYNPRWPHTPAEHTLEMRVNVERLMIEIVLLQPAPPPECDSSPRRSPVVGTGSGKPGLPRAGKQSMESEELLPL